MREALRRGLGERVRGIKGKSGRGIEGGFGEIG